MVSGPGPYKERCVASLWGMATEPTRPTKRQAGGANRADGAGKSHIRWLVEPASWGFSSSKPGLNQGGSRKEP